MKKYILLILLSLNCGSDSYYNYKCNNEYYFNKTDLPIKLYINKEFPKEYIINIESAIKQWEKYLNKKLFIIVGESYDKTPKRDGIFNIYFIKDWKHDKKYNGITRIYKMNNSNYILEFDIFINANSEYKIDMESLFVHELGHALGLKHNLNKKSVLYPTLNYFEIKVDPIKEDFDIVRCLYN